MRGLDNGVVCIHCSPRSSSIRLWVLIVAMCRCMGAVRLGICSWMSLMCPPLSGMLLGSGVAGIVRLAEVSGAGDSCSVCLSMIGINWGWVCSVVSGTGKVTIWAFLFWYFQLCSRFWLMPLSLAILAMERPELSASCTR